VTRVSTEQSDMDSLKHRRHHAGDTSSINTICCLSTEFIVY